MPRGVYEHKHGYWAGKKRPDISEMNKSRVVSDESKEKMRLAKLDNPTRFWLGKKRLEMTGPNHPMFGVSLTQTQKHLISSANLGRIPWNKGKKLPGMSGANNPKWIADRTKIVSSDKKHLDSAYKAWAKEVKNRDGWTCKLSNDNCSGRLESHHIQRWKDCPELRYIISNGITLCALHHPRKKEDEVRLSSLFVELIGNKVK